MVRYPRKVDKSNKKTVKKRTWSAEEDQKLISCIQRYGIWNWAHVAIPAGLARTGKSCRLRWMNYLRPNIKHGNITPQEEQTIINLQRLLGNQWAAIAAKLPGRTDNEIKNYWNTRLKKIFSKETRYDTYSTVKPKQEKHEASSPRWNNSLCQSNSETNADDDYHNYKAIENCCFLPGNVIQERGSLWENLLALKDLHDVYDFGAFYTDSGSTVLYSYSSHTDSEAMSFDDYYNEDFIVDLWEIEMM